MSHPNLLLLLTLVGSLLSVVTTFRRDNVEYRPPAGLPTHEQPMTKAVLPNLHRYSIAQRLGARPRFGSTALPLRQAVERVPSPTERAEEHFPIRDAVEQRPVLAVTPLGQWWNHRMAPPQTTIQASKPSSEEYQRVSPLAVDKSVYCFVESWSVYRRAPMSFSADHIDPHLCTHLVYAFAKIDANTHKLTPVDEEYDIVKGGYRSVVFLKRLNPRLKVLLSVAGPFNGMTSSANRRTFISSTVRMLHEYNFDGLDLHWQLPELEGTTPSDPPTRSPADPSTLTRLLEEMSPVFESRAWTLTLSLTGSRFHAEDIYPNDMQQVTTHLTHLLLKSYDLHGERGKEGQEGGVAVHHAPLQAPPPTQDALALFFNVDYAVRYWLKRGVPRHKLIMGIPLYARTYTLKDANQWQPGSSVLSGGSESRYTQQPGILAYYEVCEKLVEGDDVIRDTSDVTNDDITRDSYDITSDDVTKGDDDVTKDKEDVSQPWRLFRDQGNAPFMVRGDQWVGYEDPLSVQTKMRYINQQKLGGVMVWALDLDDFQGMYCGRKYPLLNAINDHLHAFDWPLAVHQPSLVSVGQAPPTFAQAPPTYVQAPPTFVQAVSILPHSNLELEWSRKSAGCSKGQFTAHPSNCNQYLQCQWGAYQIYSCPPGLHWNAKNNICDWPSRSTCRVTSPSNPQGGSKPDSKPPSGSSKPVSLATTSTNRPEWEWKPDPTSTSNPQWEWKPETTPKPKPIPNKPSKPSGKHPLANGPFKVVCYFTNWAWYRTGPAKYLPEDIDTNLCTHVLYGFAVLDFENLIIKAHDSWADFDNKFYERVVAMKKKGVHVLLAIGGWNDSQGDKYSRLVNSAASRQRFIQHVVPFLLKYDFDGLDLDWEYPKCWQVNCDKGPASDKESFGLFVKELKTAFRSHDLLLSAAVSPSKAVIDEGYDVKTMAKYLDWISVMTYDYHGQWDKKTGHLAPMYYHPEDDFDYFNANYSINYWLSEGVPKHKLVMGMPLYGQSFTLAKREQHGLNAPAPGPGQAGESTRAAGFLAYYEICSRIKNGGWTVVQDEEQRMGPYAYNGDQWISFDDKDTIRRKSEWIREMGIGGGMIWALDLDDFRNTCGGGKHPLLTIIAKTLAKPGQGGMATPTPGNDLTHGSSELMLVILPNRSRETTEERESTKREIMQSLEDTDAEIAPPMSLSAPELGSIEPETLLQRAWVSSTELLHERAMARFYQAAEENERERNTRRQRKVSSDRHSTCSSASSHSQGEMTAAAMFARSSSHEEIYREPRDIKLDRMKSDDAPTRKRSMYVDEPRYAQSTKQDRMKIDDAPPSRKQSYDHLEQDENRSAVEEELAEEEEEEEEDYSIESVEEEEEEDEEDYDLDDDDDNAKRHDFESTALGESEGEYEERPSNYMIEEDTYHPRNMTPRIVSVQRKQNTNISDNLKAVTGLATAVVSHSITIPVAFRPVSTTIISKPMSNLKPPVPDHHVRIEVTPPPETEISRKSASPGRKSPSLEADQPYLPPRFTPDGRYLPNPKPQLPKPILKCRDSSEERTLSNQNLSAKEKRDRAIAPLANVESELNVVSSHSSFELTPERDKVKKKHVRISEPGDRKSDNSGSVNKTKSESRTEIETDATKCLIHHYSDIVKEYGHVKKVATPLYLNYEDLKAAAQKVEEAQYAPPNQKQQVDYIEEDTSPEIKNIPVELKDEKTIEKQETRKLYKDDRLELKIQPKTEVKLKESSSEVKVASSKNYDFDDRVAQLEKKMMAFQKCDDWKQKAESYQTPSKKESRSLKHIEVQASEPSKIENDPYVTEKKLHSYVDYLTDVAMFIVACWLYLCKDERLAIPVLAIMVYRQAKDYTRETYMNTKQAIKNKIPARWRHKIQ